MTRVQPALASALVAVSLGVSSAALADAAPREASPPHAAGAQATPQASIVGTPSVRSSLRTSATGARYVSLQVVLRLDRSHAPSRRTTVAAPTLRAGQQLPDALFGGRTLRRIGRATRHCFVGEVAQLRRRTEIGSASWRLGLIDDQQVLAPVKRVTVRSTSGTGWTRTAAARLRCG